MAANTQRVSVNAAKTQELTAADRVIVGVLSALEKQQLMPGQPLVETDLAVRYGVGRNAVREAMQALAERGFVDLSRNRSPSLRRLDLTEAQEVLDVAEALICLLVRTAVRNFDRNKHGALIRVALNELKVANNGGNARAFARAWRRLFQVLLEVAGNRELGRFMAAVQMQILYLQFPSAVLTDIRYADYVRIAEAVLAADGKTAEAAVRKHIQRVHKKIREIDADEDSHDLYGAYFE